MNITIRKIVDEHFCFSDGKFLSSNTINTLTTVKSILTALGLEFDQHGNNKEYRKIIRLINSGAPIPVAISTVLGQ